MTVIFEPIRVITRPKKNGIGTHFGVLFPNGVVYDYTIEDGMRQVSLAQFSEGVQIVVVREIPWNMAYIVRARLEELNSSNPRKYHVLEWNCETFAEWLTSGVAKSAQVVGLIVLAGVIIALALAAKG
jgi:hypothetical protein